MNGLAWVNSSNMAHIYKPVECESTLNGIIKLKKVVNVCFPRIFGTSFDEYFASGG